MPESTQQKQWIKIDDGIHVDVTHEEFLDRFTSWLESNGWHFAGHTEEDKN